MKGVVVSDAFDRTLSMRGCRPFVWGLFRNRHLFLTQHDYTTTRVSVSGAEAGFE